jgi:hypothetical protein
VGITGVITAPGGEDNGAAAMAPTGLGERVDSYLNAHGYDANSRLDIMFAWREKGDVADFIAALSTEGMAISEAEWLWCLLSDNN